MFIARRQRIVKLIDEGFVVCNGVFKKSNPQCLLALRIYIERISLSLIPSFL